MGSTGVSTEEKAFSGQPKMERYPRSDLDVLVVGGGLAGLTFAIEAFRKGHEVRLIDRRPHFNDYGDLIAIQASALQTAKAWPDFLERVYEEELAKSVKIYRHDGSYLGNGGSFALSTTRARLHSLLHQYVHHLGIPIRYSARATDYFEDDDHAGVVLEDGEKLTADIVVAADGIGTKSWNLIQGFKENPISSGFAVLRATYPVERALASPVFAEDFNEVNEGRMVFGPGAHLVACRTNKHMIFLITHKDEGGAEEDWSKTTNPAKILPYVEGWAPWVSEMIKAAPEDGTVDFKLMWRNPREKCCSPKGRVIQIGDAAHTFLPTSASGATIAMEDGHSLATCLQLGGKSNAPLAAKVHNRLRFERVTCAQKMGFKTREKLHNTRPGDEETFTSKGEGANTFAGQWVTKHDPEQYVYEMYGRCANHILTGAPFENTNYPAGHTFKLWTVKEMLEASSRREIIEDDGDWS